MMVRSFQNLGVENSRISFYTHLDLNPIFKNTQEVSQRRQPDKSKIDDANIDLTQMTKNIMKEMWDNSFDDEWNKY